MPYELTFVNEDGFLSVHATGVRTRDAVLAMANEILNTCDKRQYNRVMVDVRKMTGQLNTFETYDMTTVDLTRLRRFRNIKIALLDLEKNRERVVFFETVSRNMGFNLMAFLDMNDATKWLLEK